MARMDPDTPPIGRQPWSYMVTPSKPQPWYGLIVGVERVDLAPAMHVIVAQGGERFTAQQVAGVVSRGRDPATIEAMTVKRQATDREIHAGMQMPAVFAFECPIIGPWHDRVRVIAPSGEVKAVRPDGWAHHPRLYPRDQWGRAA